MASKSLPGKIVDKVQVIDQSSEVTDLLDSITGIKKQYLTCPLKKKIR